MINPWNPWLDPSCGHEFSLLNRRLKLFFQHSTQSGVPAWTLLWKLSLGREWWAVGRGKKPPSVAGWPGVPSEGGKEGPREMSGRQEGRCSLEEAEWEPLLARRPPGCFLPLT